MDGNLIIDPIMHNFGILCSLDLSAISLKLCNIINIMCRHVEAGFSSIFYKMLILIRQLDALDLHALLVPGHKKHRSIIRAGLEP